ncbi:MAG: hypothetical protein KDC54_24445 [Lewinella sp.]|nr:hypothetical protein [Lewinella sp.]
MEGNQTQQELAGYLSALFYHHDRLALPGIGTFELSPQPALVDQVQGEMTPPTRHIVFNTGQMLDDGLLLAHISEHSDLGIEEARQWLARATEEIKTTLDAQEMVTLPGVGRLYRDYEKRIKFLTDHTNFRLDTFGLLPVQAEAIGRATPVATPPPPSPPPSPAATVSARPGLAASISDWFQRNLAWIALLSVLIIAFAVYFIFIRPRTIPTPDPTVDLPTERLNTPPTREDADATTSDDPEDLEDATEDAATDEGPDTEAPTLAPDEHTALIAVGLFSETNNAERLVEKLARAGFNPVTRAEGRYTRVGIAIRYTEDATLRSELRTIQRDWEDSAFIMEIDGVREE